MKKIFLISIVLLCFHFIAYSQGINFYNGSFADAKSEAKKQNKYLMVDCYTEWCGWCKFMDRKTYPVPEVGSFYNANFIAIRMDMEKGEGIALNQKYNIKMYPSFVFFNPNGDFEMRYTGADTSAKGFINIGRNAMDTSKNFQGLLGRLYRGQKDKGDLIELIKATQYYIDPVTCERALSVYWETVTSDEINQQYNWDLFKLFEMDINSKPFDFFYNNKEHYLSVHKTKEDSNLFYTKAAYAIKIAADTRDDKLFNKAKPIALLSNDKNIRYSICVNELPYYIQKENLDAYSSDIDNFFKSFGNDWIGGVAWNMERSTNDPKFLKKALEYAELSIQLNKTFDRTATYARILYKLGKYKDANAAANDALVLAQQSGSESDKKRNVDSTNELIEKIKKSSERKN